MRPQLIGKELLNCLPSLLPVDPGAWIPDPKRIALFRHEEVAVPKDLAGGLLARLLLVPLLVEGADVLPGADLLGAVGTLL
jgi:hypothetical protein